MALVSVVFPWSTWPMVPMFTWGLVRSNLALAILPPSCSPGFPHPLAPKLETGIEPVTPSLPRTCSTTELLQQPLRMGCCMTAAWSPVSGAMAMDDGRSRRVACAPSPGRRRTPCALTLCGPTLIPVLLKAAPLRWTRRDENFIMSQVTTLSSFFHGFQGGVIEPLVERFLWEPPHLAHLHGGNLPAARLAVDGVRDDAEVPRHLVHVHDPGHDHALNPSLPPARRPRRGDT